MSWPPGKWSKKLTFTFNPTVSESIKKIGGVLEVVTIKIEESNRNYSFVVVDDKTINFDKTSVLEQENKSAKIWEFVFDKTYRKTNSEDNEDDFDSWTSVYDKRPFPRLEMNEWRNNAVDRIKHLNPKSLFEIGCGTGLLMWKLYEAVDYYLGIDPSQHAIDKLDKALKTKGIKHVKVLRDTAAHIEQYWHERFDTVVMNSVIQYFPGTNYLKTVIENVLKSSCNSLYIGDIKSLRHGSIFQTSVALRQSNGKESAKACLGKSVSAQDNELSVNDEVLEILAGNEYSLEIQLKKEGFHNEMSCYRYDAIFHKVKDARTIEPDISSSFSTMEDLERLIRGNVSSTIEILGIPNSRLVADVWAFDNSSEFDGTVEDLLKMSEAKKIRSIDPSDLYKLGDELSLNTRVVFSKNNLSLINALYEPKSEVFQTWRPEKGMTYPFFTNDPLDDPLGRSAAPLISQYLKDQLVQMNEDNVPDQIILIHQLPLHDGSLDIVRLVDLIPD